MCIFPLAQANSINLTYTDGQKGPTDVKSCSHTPCLSAGGGAAQQEHTNPPTARHPAAFIESLPPAKQSDSKKKKNKKESNHHHVTSQQETRETRWVTLPLSVHLETIQLRDSVNRLQENQCSADMIALAAQVRYK